jgi:hypothetical protein
MVMNSANLGNVNGRDYVGGIVGSKIAKGPRSRLAITDCINSGSINGNAYIGGVIGSVSDNAANAAVNNTKITNCINAGLLEGNSAVGGIVGENARNYMEMRKCINTGVIISRSSMSAAGVLAYNNAGTFRFENCYYDKQMCIYGGLQGYDYTEITGKLTNEMTGSQLSSSLGTDFVYANNLYPKLKELSSHIASIIGCSPVYLDDKTTDFDKYNNVRKDFKINIENNVR